MRPRPTLLFIAPIRPAETGNGLAMRAGVFLDALAQDYAVTLLVVPVSGALDGRVSPFIAARTQRLVTVPLDGVIDPLWTLIGRIADQDARAKAFVSYGRPSACRYATAAGLARIVAAVGNERFDAVHVMRSYMAPYAEPFMVAPGAAEQPDGESRPPSVGALAAPYASLDLDDDEAATHVRLAQVAQRRGTLRDATLLAAEATKYERHEAVWLPRFSLLIACTDAHQRRIAAAYPGSRAAVVPNTVALPPPPPWRSTVSTESARQSPDVVTLPAEARPHRAKQHVLFVGNLSYLPNVDGIAGFVRDVLPRLRAKLGDGVVLRIGGSAPTAEIAALATLPGIELVADPPDLAAHYAWADLAVIPLAAGGGTRIKLLEAFAHGVPVVATTIGAEGVDARHGTHLLLADTPAAFADACALLLEDPRHAERVAAAARVLVETRYTHALGVRLIREALPPKR